MPFWPRRRDFALSCVLDDAPAIWASFAPWLATALERARIHPSRIHVHHACPLRADIAELCRAHGIATHAVERFDPRFPHMNKIRACATDFGAVRHVLLTDVDIVFARSVPLDRIRAPVAGKPVDLPNPPLEILRPIFIAAGLPVPEPVASTRGDFATLPGNFNGGLYIIERAQLARVGAAWSRWARWLGDRIEQLDRWRTNSDQVAFCLAVNELNIPLQHLADEWNLPLHLPIPDGPEPLLLHHHADFDAAQRLQPTSSHRTRAALERINRTLASFARRG